MIGKVFVTSTGYDPEAGKHVKDPYLGSTPTLGACRPDIRRQLKTGDHIFVVSGKVEGVNQFIIGGFEIAEKIHACEAYERFPELRLRQLDDGQITGNIIVDADGEQHELDQHGDSYSNRLSNYVIGVNPIVMDSPEEVWQARTQTIDVLCDVFETNGNSIREVMGRCRNLNVTQIHKLRNWMESIKNPVDIGTLPVFQAQPLIN